MWFVYGVCVCFCKVVGDDGGYSVLARACDGQKVEILVKPYETEDGSDRESDEGGDEDGGDE